MSNVTGIALAKNKDGRLELVATSTRQGSRDTVWHAWQTTSGEWTRWQKFGKPGGSHDGAAMARNVDGRLEAIVWGRAEEVSYRWQTDPNNGWSEWDSLGSPGGDGLMRSLVLGQNKDGRLEVFALRQDATVWHAWQRPGAQPEAGWTEWRGFGQPGTALWGNLAVGANADGRLEVFAPAAPTGGNPTMRHRWQRQGRWSDWHPLHPAGSSQVPVGSPVLARNADGCLELFMVGDGAVWHARQNTPGGTWAPWSSLSGEPVVEFVGVGVGTYADDRLVLFATSDNGGLYHREQTVDGDWTGWESVGRVGGEVDPTLALNADGRLELFLLLPTGGMFQLTQTLNGTPYDWPPASAGARWPPP
jgi:hypothetical protein